MSRRALGLLDRIVRRIAAARRRLELTHWGAPMPSPWFAVCLALGAGVLGYAQDFGSVHVTVRNAKEEPVQQGLVVIGREWEAAQRTCWSDTKGTCTINHLPMGEYEVYFLNYKEGHPSPNTFYFGRNFKPTMVTVQRSNLSQDIVLHLLPKQGFLKLVVIDAVSGKPILPVSFRISWASDPDNTIATGRPDDLVVLVPGSVPLNMVASSGGYEDWQYASPYNPADHTLLLRAGEHRTLTIHLRPKR